MNISDRLVEQLMLHEGVRLSPYRDTVGKLTIGVGRNLDDVGITREEALYMLIGDITRTRRDCLLAFPWFAMLSPVRQRVVIDMAFNLGIAGLKKFHATLAAIADRDWDRAAVEMLSSKWAEQVGQRARRLAEMMRSDRDYAE